MAFIIVKNKVAPWIKVIIIIFFDSFLLKSSTVPPTFYWLFDSTVKFSKPLNRQHSWGVFMDSHNINQSKSVPHLEKNLKYEIPISEYSYFPF